jgi:hypothetical protein
MDFSYAGYMGGGVSIPSVPVQRTIAPSGTDDTAAIQAAIREVSSLPLVGGLRGAVALQAGTYMLSAPLTISASGVVLRGAGARAADTTIQMTGQPHTAFTIGGSGSYQSMGAAASITDAYVLSGARSFHVSDATGFAVGDAVLVRRPITAAWVQLMGMDKLVDSAGKPQTWLAVGGTINTDRTIQAISGNTVSLDVPLSDSLDAQYLSPTGSSMVKYGFAGRISQVGLEDLRVVGPALDVPLADGDGPDRRTPLREQPTFGHLSPSEMGDGPARRRQRLSQFAERHAGRGLLESRHPRIRARLDRGLGRGVEREDTVRSGTATARFRKLVHRLHGRGRHTRSRGRHDDAPQWCVRVFGNPRLAGQPLPGPVMRSTRSSSSRQYRLLIASL